MKSDKCILVRLKVICPLTDEPGQVIRYTFVPVHFKDRLIIRWHKLWRLTTHCIVVEEPEDSGHNV
jgi:hypothetical protein